LHYESISEQQRQAIIHTDGPALVLAGPGCGKTFVITHRVAYLIREKNVPPRQIAVFTFTKAAALEMRQRCVLLCQEATDVVFGTFHSIFYRILLSDSRFAQFQILTEHQKKQILTQILYTKYSDIHSINQKIPQLIQSISYYLNTGSIPDQEADPEEFLSLYNLYKRECLMRRRFDFDLLLSECLALLKENEKLRSKWQNYFCYMLVDEFQDTNEIQMEALSILAEKSRNLFVVGDDDQSIYSFRGADPSVMFRFIRQYPDAAQMPLFENFRSGREILRAAAALISHNEHRFEKQICGHRKTEGLVEVIAAKDNEREIEEILRRINSLLMNTDPTPSIAILCRTSSRFLQLYSALRQSGILCDDKEQEKECYQLYEDEAVKDILSYLKFVFAGRKRADLIPVLNKPQRYLSRIYFEEAVVDLPAILSRYQKAWEKYDNHGSAKFRFTENLPEYSFIKPRESENEVEEQLKKLMRDVECLKSLDSYGCVCYILHVIGYEKWYLSGREEYERERIKELWQLLKQQAKLYPDVSDWLMVIDSVHALSAGDSLDFRRKELGKRQKSAEKSKTGVRLMTYHGAKGLEFDHVFLPFLNEHSVPHRKAQSREEMEEERRMFYVAMTRTRESLTISYVLDSPAEPSVFLKEISDQLNP